MTCLRFLLPANEVCGKVIFSIMCVSVHRWSHVTITHDEFDLTMRYLSDMEHWDP